MKGKAILRNSIPYWGLVIVIVLFTILTKGNTLQPQNLQLVAEQSFTILISAAGVVFVMSMGSLDFSQGSLLAISCYVAAMFSGTNIALAIIGAVGTGIAVGIFNGFLNAKLTIPNIPSRTLDYMQVGIPVLAALDPATDMGDIMREGDFGLSCISGDMPAFAKNVELLLDEAVRKRMGKNSREYFENNWTSAHTVDVILSHFDKQ